MALYRFEMKHIQRGKGQGALAAAAYRAGCRLADARTGRVHDYRPLAHRVVATEILGPETMPARLGERALLWSTLEAMEGRRDARLAREFLLSLPHEFDDAGRLELVRGFAREQLVAAGMVVDIAWHRPDPRRGDDPRNHHAHLLASLRCCGPEGFSATKTRLWNSRESLRTWRTAWSVHVNRALERGGVRARVDDRSLEAQRTEAMARADVPALVRLARAPEPWVPRAALEIGRRTRDRRDVSIPPQMSRTEAIDASSQPRLAAKFGVLADNARRAEHLASGLRALAAAERAGLGTGGGGRKARFIERLLAETTPAASREEGEGPPREWLLRKLQAQDWSQVFVAWLLSDAQLLALLRERRIAQLRARYLRPVRRRRAQVSHRRRSRTGT
ncbi:MAG: hypothetical protein GC150_07550 [Rhizobiales bacterium]|nr:hypothetical protein [Hyphomicrobiales bacterium]